MKQVDTLLFDLDGTILNTLDDLGTSMNRTLVAFGFPSWPLSDYRRMVGNGMRSLTERALGNKATPELIDQVLPAFLKVHNENCTKLTIPYEGITEILHSLKAAGIHLFVVTNKTEAQAVKIVEHFFGKSLFDGIYGQVPGRPTKPHPATTLLAMEQVGTSAQRTIFVGDSDVDIETAQAAGIKSIGVAWGFRGEEELRAAGADFLAYCAEDILQILGK